MRSLLTASHFGDIMNADRRDIPKFLEDMYDPKDLSKVPAIRHGNTYESVALERFSQLTGKKVLKSGFCIDPELPFLGASPDAFIEGEDAVVEVKCSYAGRRSKITTATLKHFPYLQDVNGTITLKKTHKYYYQLIGQIKLSKKSYGYFVAFTHEDLFYEKIDLDDDLFMNTMLPKLKSFYYQEYCPHIASALKKK